VVTRLMTRPPMVCPSCRTALDGGPVRYRCEPCGQGVAAADAIPEHAPAAPAGSARVTFAGAVRERLPGAAASAAIAVGSLVAGYLTTSAAVHLGVLPW
jgi:hypothetical protein